MPDINFDKLHVLGGSPPVLEEEERDVVEFRRPSAPKSSPPKRHRVRLTKGRSGISIPVRERVIQPCKVEEHKSLVQEDEMEEEKAIGRRSHLDTLISSCFGLLYNYG